MVIAIYGCVGQLLNAKIMVMYAQNSTFGNIYEYVIT